MNPRIFTVEGQENGGVLLFKDGRDDPIAEGGCICCADNDVTLADLIRAAEIHSEDE
ncbi:hypothetical protein [Streptomyces sp. NPDC050485]|uniref:hypothetical protein n=1 Tax=Streptomyces sp. NPDC050485 TaxID=3365617 RepID=UPI0037A17082